jgi:hypothetical protein
LSGLSAFFWAVFHYETLRTYLFYSLIVIVGIFWVIHPMWLSIRKRLDGDIEDENERQWDNAGGREND